MLATFGQVGAAAHLGRHSTAGSAISGIPTRLADTRICAICGAVVTAAAVPYGVETRLFWRICACREQVIQAAERMHAATVARYQQTLATDTRADTPLDAFAQQRGMTLAAFRPGDLRRTPKGAHAWDIATGWLAAILALAPARPVHSATAAALFLYSETRGNGKTHAAVALAEQAHQAGWPVAILEEDRFAEQCWKRDIDGQARLITRFAQMPGLLVIDDIGQREPSRGLRNLYNTLIGRRYTDGGWTVFTSNYTPTQLLTDGAITESTMSRLGAMIGRRIVECVGDDHRLAHQVKH